MTSVDAANDSRSQRLPHLPALDGLRTLALAAVLLEHGGVAVVRGGFLGVTVFFVLSGFLVTALLLEEQNRTGGIDLVAFWRRRARRLVPASIAFFAFALLYLAVGPDRPPSSVFGDGIASLGWLANWRFVFTERSYGDLFADPTPFAHLWSLAVEEQFYLGLPLVASLVLRHGRPRALGVVSATLIAASAALMFVLYEPRSDPARVYYGTDTRLAELAVGVLLAVLLVGRGRLARLSARATTALSVAGVVALGGLVAAMIGLSLDDPTTYRGGFLVVAVLSAIVVAASTQPSSVIARALASEPLPELGRLTYAAYLFHWPVFLWVDEQSTNFDPPALLTVRVVLTFVLAAISYHLVEQPIRTGRILPPRIAGVVWANATVAAAALLVVVSSIAGSPNGSSLLASGAGVNAPPVPPAPPPPAASPPPASASPATSTPAPGGARSSPTTLSTTPAATPPGGRPAAPPTTASAQPGPTTTAPPPAPSPDALRVAVVGDSLALNLGQGLEAWAKSHDDLVVYNLSISACPVSRGGTRRFEDGTDYPIPEHCDWWDDPANERRRKLFAFDPDIVLVEDALNEIVDRKLPEWPDYRRVGDPRFDAWLLSEYRAAAEVFSSEGATVVYADAPCADFSRVTHWNSISDADRRIAALNRIYDNVVAATTKVADLYDRLCPGGQYTDDVEGVEGGRYDGFHLTAEATNRLAERWLMPFLLEVEASRPPELES